MTSPYPGAATDVAVVGMAGRFPGARNLRELWRNLRDGIESVVTFTDDELLAAGEDPALLQNPNYVRAGAPLTDMELFDAGFFGFNQREAAILDPQHRHFLEVAWEALEDAGHPPENFAGSVGVFAGAGMHAYFAYNLAHNRKLMEQVGLFLVRHTGNDKDFLTTRVSYCLNLKGPSLNVQTACSTSLVAIHLAAQSLLNGECDMALAGGVTIEVPHRLGYVFQEGEILSPDGHCRAFDHRSKGTIFGSGVGVVVLRRAADAWADGDAIRAIIRGSAINNDGASKVGYLAPSVDGQAECIAQALAIADVKPETITYIEAHGTGTPVGDPIEISALTQVFRTGTDKKNFCGIGSLKTNIGHLDTAAGVGALIKTTLALENRQLPPSLNFEAPNPLCEFGSSPFYVNAKLQDWKTHGFPRRAGVNSLGVGGTNAHVILEEAPARPALPDTKPAKLLCFSARSAAALDRAQREFAEFLRAHPETPFAEAAYTLQVGRRAFKHRRVLACRDTADALAVLDASDTKRIFTQAATDEEPSVVFMFPGGGAQYPNMGRQLYETEPVFRQHVDRGLDVVKSRWGLDLKPWLYPRPGSAGRRPSVFGGPPETSFPLTSPEPQKESEPRESGGPPDSAGGPPALPGVPDGTTDTDAAAQLEKPANSILSIFIVEHALAQLWLARGVTPVAMTGHSLGEYVAACLAGVMTLEDALAIVAARGRVFEKLPEGAMLSVPLPEADVRRLLGPQHSLAAVNGPGLCVVSGPVAAIAELERELTAKEIDCQRLKISVAAHSTMIEPFLAEFAREVAAVRLRPPTIPFISNLTGQWAKADEVTDPNYWVRHLRQTVRFADGLGVLLAKEKNCVLLEVGPGTSLGSLVKQHLGRTATHSIVPSLPHPKDTLPSAQFFLGAMGRLWLAGCKLDWAKYYGDEKRRRVSLPTYPFERVSYWIEASKPAVSEAAAVATPAPAPLAKLLSIDDWFSRPVWRKAPVPVANGKCLWLVFGDDDPLHAAVIERLRRRGDNVVVATSGEKFARHDGAQFSVNPASREDFEALLSRLIERNEVPTRVAHLWGFGSNSPNTAETLDRCFYSLMNFAQAWGEQELSAALHVAVVTSGMQQVAAEPVPHPERAVVLGPCKVIPKEFAQLSFASVDATVPSDGSRNHLLDSLVAELTAQTPTPIVALREDGRWTQSFEPFRLARPASTSNRLRERGVYLITGGLGGIGLTLAQHLAKSVRARLVLVGRSTLPPREEWDTWLARHEADDDTSARLRRLREIEQLGGEVLTLAADAASAEQMRFVIAAALQRFGAIHGVIHGAGVLEDGVVQFKTRESTERVFAPKIHGTLALEAALAGQPLDFFTLFSSTSSVLGPAGQIDYTAANAFLNAFAQSRNGRGGTRVTALSWGVWGEVGMAVNAASGAAEPLPSGPVAQHPWLGRRIKDSPTETVFAARYTANDFWVFDQHRLKTGEALMPGTGYLELARAAWAEGVGQAGSLSYADAPVEIRDLFFLAPLEVKDTHPKDVRITLKRSAASAELVVTSRLGETWREHARGELHPLATPPTEPIALAEITTRCQQRHVRWGPHEQFTKQEEFLSFGPRWKALREIHFGDNEALAVCELPEPFAGDLDVFRAHPAVLDLALHCGLPLVRDYESDDSFFVPMSCGVVRLYRPVPRRVYSHARLKSDRAAQREVAAFDVTLFDEQGRVIVEVNAFVARRVTPETLRVHETEFLAADAARADGETLLQRLLRHGILPLEGVEVFERVLAAEAPAHVIASSLSLRALLDLTQPKRSAPRPSVASAATPSTPKQTLAPRDEYERMLCGLWQELLGVERVGLRDNFFELGGHSLIAVRLFNRIKKQYKVDLGLSALFEAPTVEQIAGLIRTELKVSFAPSVESDAPSTTSASASGVRPRGPCIVPLRTEGSGPPLYCLHGMGGNPIEYLALVKYLRPGRPVYGIQAQGLDGKRPIQTQVEEIATNYARQIAEFQPEGPYYFVGGSFGGMVAYEIAQQFRRQGRHVQFLGMFDTFGKGYPKDLPSTTRVHRWVFREWQRWRHHWKSIALLSGAERRVYIRDRALKARKQTVRHTKSFLKKTRRRIELLRLPKALRMQARMTGEEVSLMKGVEVPKTFQAVAVATTKAAREYDPQPYDGKVILFRAQFQPLGIYEDPTNGWGPYVKDLEIINIPGYHGMMREPFVRTLAHHVNEALARAEANFGTPPPLPLPPRSDATPLAQNAALI